MQLATLLQRLALAVLVGGSAAAQCEQRRASLDNMPGDQFARSISIDGPLLAVGAWRDGDAGALSGSVYVFLHDGSSWSQSAKLVPADGAPGDHFGSAVSLDVGTLFVGALRDDDAGTDSGSVYVFERTGLAWNQVTKLVGSQVGPGDEFGTSLHVVGDLAVVGAREATPFGQASGAAYVFERIGGVWQETAYLTASDGGMADYYGQAVVVDPPQVLVGAYGEDDGGSGSGAVYAYAPTGANGTWVETQKLEPADPGSLDFFGFSLAADHGRLVVGAYGKFTAAGNLAGAAYVFERTAGLYDQAAKLLPAQQVAEDGFGFSVAVARDRILVGALDSENQGLNSGAGHRYRFDGVGWLEEAVTDYAALVPGQRLGFSAAMDGLFTVLGAMPASGVGSVWIERGSFDDCNANGRMDGCDIDLGGSLDLNGDRKPDECEGIEVFCTCNQAAPCGNEDPLGGCVNSLGAGARLYFEDGTPSVSADDLVLRASRLPPTTYALFFMGPSQGNPAPLGDGLRCVSGGLQRFPLLISNGGGIADLGPGMVAYSATQLPASGLITAGSTWNFQGWYRDAFSSCTTSNVTNAMAVTFVP